MSKIVIHLLSFLKILKAVYKVIRDLRLRSNEGAMWNDRVKEHIKKQNLKFDKTVFLYLLTFKIVPLIGLPFYIYYTNLLGVLGLP